MIKKIILVVAAAIALPFVMNAQKFGVVDANDVLTNLPDFATMRDQIAEASKHYEDEFKKLQEEMDKKYAEFQGLPEETPNSIKELRLNELQELDQKMQQFRNTASQDLQRQQETMMAPIEQKLMEAVRAVGQEGGFTFIFQDGQALYQGTDVVNVTAEVKAKLGIK